MVSSPHRQRERERERERTRKESTPLRPAQIVLPPPLAPPPRSRCPTTQIMRRPSLFFFFFPQRFFSRSGRHRSTSLIWLSPTTSPRLRSTAPLSGPGLSLITNPPLPHHWSPTITDPPLPHHWSSTGESHPRTDLSLSLSHNWSCDFDFFCFDFCFLCCLYILILCNNICLTPKKMWETW